MAAQIWVKIGPGKIPDLCCIWLIFYIQIIVKIYN